MQLPSFNLCTLPDRLLWVPGSRIRLLLTHCILQSTRATCQRVSRQGQCPALTDHSRLSEHAFRKAMTTIVSTEKWQRPPLFKFGTGRSVRLHCCDESLFRPRQALSLHMCFTPILCASPQRSAESIQPKSFVSGKRSSLKWVFICNPYSTRHLFAPGVVAFLEKVGEPCQPSGTQGRDIGPRFLGLLNPNLTLSKILDVNMPDRRSVP